MQHPRRVIDVSRTRLSGVNGNANAKHVRNPTVIGTDAISPYRPALAVPAARIDASGGTTRKALGNRGLKLFLSFSFEHRALQHVDYFIIQTVAGALLQLLQCLFRR